MTIRQPHAGDAGDKALMEAFFDQMGFEARAYFNHGDGNRRFMESYMDGTGGEQSIHWIADDGDKVAGYVFLDQAATGIPWLGIAVAEYAKGRHLGRQLIATAQDWCKAHGRGGIMLITHQANIRAQMLYSACGFNRLGNHSSGEVLFYWRVPMPMPAPAAQ